MILPRGPLFSAGPAASFHLGQAYSTSPVASVHRRVFARPRVLKCLLIATKRYHALATQLSDTMPVGRPVIQDLYEHGDD